MINLRTPNARYREHAAQERLRAIYERRMAILLSQELRRLANSAKKGVSLAQNISIHRTVIGRILRQTYGHVFDAFGAKLYKTFRNLKASEEDDTLAAARSRYIDRNVGEKVDEISDTSREKLKEIIDEAEAEDLTSSEVADLIDERLGEDIADRRAMTIARTEVHSASQDSQFEAAQATGLNLRKRWVAVEDNRTRPDHVDADGQVVDMEDSFVVGDDELLYAGDPDGSPEQVINCRCITVYEETNGN